MNAPKVITIQALDGLQYDIVRFKVKPGEKIKITLGNVSDMSHNLLIVRPGTTLNVVEAALQLAEKGPKMDDPFDLSRTNQVSYIYGSCQTRYLSLCVHISRAWLYHVWRNVCNAGRKYAGYQKR